MDFKFKEKYEIGDLLEIMKILRSENGCPWDREQDHKSIRKDFIEEVYEAIEAIDSDDSELLKEELGDVLLQVVFHAQMEREQGGFSLDDVADGVCKKLILRHPHVFGDVRVADSAQVLTNWDAIKRVEKDQKTVTDSLNAVARSLPALWRAEKVQKKAAKAGFDWPDISGALDKLEEELAELRQALQSGEGVEDELGDVLFSAVNAARFAGVDPEQALTGSTDKFIRRFSGLEQAALAAGRKLEDMTLDEMEDLYQNEKEHEKQ